MAQFGAAPGGQDQVAGLIVDTHPLHPFECQQDVARVGARRDHKVILQIAVVIVEDEVDALVYAGGPHLGVVRGIGLADLSRIETGQGRPRTAALEFHSHGGVLWPGLLVAIADDHREPVAGHEELIGRTSRDPPGLRRGLSAIGFKYQRLGSGAEKGRT